MPRTARASVGDMWYHVLNRGNRREAVFHRAADYDAFVEAMADARRRLPVDLLGYCLMPNHVTCCCELVRTASLGVGCNGF